MTLCRTCRRDRTTAELTAAESITADGKSVQPPEPGSGTEHPAVLLLRVWHQDAQVRCRLMSVSGPAPAPVSTAVQGVDAICDAVRQWLLQI